MATQDKSKVNKWDLEFQHELERAISASGLEPESIHGVVFPKGEAYSRTYNWSIHLRVSGKPVLILGKARQNGNLDYRELMLHLQRQLKFKRIPWHNRLAMWLYVTFGNF